MFNYVNNENTSRLHVEREGHFNSLHDYNLVLLNNWVSAQ